MQCFWSLCCVCWAAQVDAVLTFPDGVGPGYTQNFAYMFCGDSYCKWDLVKDELNAGPRTMADGFGGFPFPKVRAVSRLAARGSTPRMAKQQRALLAANAVVP